MPPASRTEGKIGAELGNGVQILTDTHGVDFNNYLSRMVANVRKGWYATIPESARGGKKGKTIVTFKIERNGSVEAVSVERGSGDDELDRAALKAIEGSDPYEPLPGAFDGPYIILRFVFLYNLQLAAAKE